MNMDKIMSLNADEILIINGLQPVAKEAKEHCNLIHQTFHNFEIGENCTVDYHDSEGNNFEYLAHDGVWQARYSHQSYDVKVDADTIFDYYRAEWLIENGFAEEFKSDCCLTEYGKKKEVCKYFRSFVKKIHPEA